jgi:hypothetical protein
MTTSTNPARGWELGQCEGFCFRLCICSNWFKSWLHSNSEFAMVGFKIGNGSDV